MDVTLQDGAQLRLCVDDFTDPWANAEAVLFIHGNSESGRAWDRWVPAFARDFRLLRPDLRGFGHSQAMPEDHAWSLDQFADDLVRALDAAQVQRCHVVGAKIGGLLALHLAATHGDRLLSLSVVGAPVSGAELTGGQTPVEEIRGGGVGAWARRTMAARLGPGMPPAAHAWWGDYMDRTPVSTQLGFLRYLPGFDVRPVLPQIHCPALVVATLDDTPVGSVASTQQWQRRIPHSTLVAVQASGYHAALTAADRIAPEVAAFCRQHGRLNLPQR